VVGAVGCDVANGIANNKNNLRKITRPLNATGT
jgi:hypothetical protein